FRIPNIVSVVILGAFILVFSGLSLLGERDIVFLSLMSHIGAGLLVFVITIGLFALKQLGAGDSKFASVIALWVGFSGLIPFLFYMSLAGGVVAAISLVLKKWKPVQSPLEGSWIAKAQDGHPSVPYGIALAFGALAAFIVQGYFDFSRWESVF
ncbi:MAG TPA: prepilin peptidase, partial [Alphaproteobacteria bacterium]|nr:prepilin peptidase [Alphaproteobacteria bacterium]